MGHRALVAYARPDGLYDLRYSHWGGDELVLVGTLTAQTPLGNGRVDADLLADSVALDRLLSAFLDPCVHEALYIVSQSFEVTAYRVLWLEWSDGREAGHGAIVEVEPGGRDFAVRTWFQATKTVLGDVIEMGGLSRRAARTYLERRIREDYAGRLYTYATDRDGAALFSGSDMDSDSSSDAGLGSDPRSGSDSDSDSDPDSDSDSESDRSSGNGFG